MSTLSILGSPTVVLALLTLAALALSALAAATVLGSARSSVPPSGPTPPISVLKPLKGVTPDLYDNLAAFARQNYPRYELVFGAADPDDPALAVAERVRQELPAVPMTIVRGSRCAPGPGDLNPKVSNLAGLTGGARYEWLLVSDADVRPGPGYLTALVSELHSSGSSSDRNTSPKTGDDTSHRPVGLVASLLVGTREESLGAAWDALQLAAWVTPALSVAERLAGHVCVVGKSMLMPRTALDEVGGWTAVRDVLAEDYVLGRKIYDAGYRVALSRAPVPTVDRRRSVRSFLARHLRWAQMRARIAPAAYVAEPLLNPIPLALAWLASILLGGGLGPARYLAAVALVTAVCAAKVGLDATLARHLRGAWPAARHLVTVPLKDLAILLVWAVALVKRTIAWRGTRLLIGRGSRLRPLSGVSRKTPGATEPAGPDWGQALGELDSPFGRAA